MLDSSTSLYYYNDRYYNPTSASWISRDPIHAKHLYAYSNNAPIHVIDVLGKEAVSASAVILALLGRGLAGAVVGAASAVTIKAVVDAVTVAFTDETIEGTFTMDEYIPTAIGGAVGGALSAWFTPLVGAPIGAITEQILENHYGNKEFGPEDMVSIVFESVISLIPWGKQAMKSAKKVAKNKPKCGNFINDYYTESKNEIPVAIYDKLTDESPELKPIKIQPQNFPQHNHNETLYYETLRMEEYFMFYGRYEKCNGNELHVYEIYMNYHSINRYYLPYNTNTNYYYN